MKSVLFAVCCLFVCSRVEAWGDCNPQVLVDANACFQSAGVNLAMFTNARNYFATVKYICTNENVIDRVLDCAKTVADKCKDDKSLGIASALLSQIDFDHVKAAFHKSCSHIEDFDGQEDCLETNFMTTGTCCVSIQNKLMSMMGQPSVPSQDEIADLLCSVVAEMKKCFVNGYGSCGKASTVFTDFEDAYLPIKPCS